MLFNCHDCLKTISSRHDRCPHCQANTSHSSVKAVIEKRQKRKKHKLYFGFTHRVQKMLRLS